METIQFGHGPTLKFMSGGGDKSRAGFTSRVVVITETDGMDMPWLTSRESDKVTQLEARTRAYGSRKRIYMECTVSTENGRTWQECTRGSRSRIVLPCPHCNAWVSPEREHLTGWQGAESQQAARRSSAFACPSCGHVWSADERVVANAGTKLLHEGQTISPDGTVQGDPPQTDTLGFRWSAVNNLLLTPGDLAADEWRAAHDPDEENAEREMRQFVWALPVVPTKLNQTALEVNELAGRITDLPRGVVPVGAKVLTAGVDLGKYLAHWVLVAWSEGAAGHVVDYGRIEVASDSLGVENALVVALREFKGLALAGWPRGKSDGEVVLPEQVFVDSGYTPQAVYAFCRETGFRFRPAVGRGAGQQHRQWYNRPTQTGSVVKYIGEGMHANWLPAEQVYLMEIDADHWKPWVHQRLVSPVGSPGAMTFFHATPQEHLPLAKHLTAEVKTEEFVAGKGVLTRWERLRRQNHWLDALYNACAAGHGCGVRLVQEQRDPPRPRQPQPQKRESGDERDYWISTDEIKARWYNRHRW